MTDLHDILPREQHGARTGELFEFQYHQAAAEALALLAHANVVCIYCEWHDDFVVEHAGSLYLFHQVKTRKASRGPWDFLEFFGAYRKGNRKKFPAAKSDSIFGRMYDNRKKFGARCHRFVFVTDNDIDDEFRDLVKSIEGASSLATMAGKGKATFDLLVAELSQTFLGLTDQVLFELLRLFEIREAFGKVSAPQDCQNSLAFRIIDASEVNVAPLEAQKISAQLVALVRRRSHEVFSAPPTTVAELRAHKGIEIGDLLAVLCLSKEGYRELKTKGRPAVLALSRLQRLCKKNNTPPAMIIEMCRYKSDWDTWWLTERLRVEPLDDMAMKRACADVLAAHSEKKIDFDQVVTQAKVIAQKYSTLGTTKPLTPSLVLGRIFGLWADSAS